MIEKYWNNMRRNIRRNLSKEYKAQHSYVEHNPGSVGAWIRSYFE